MNQLILKNAMVVLEDRIQPGGVIIRDGRIHQVFTEGQTPAGLGEQEAIDLGRAYLAPGMIDIHIHGSAGVDVLDADHDRLTKLSRFLASEGVTGYFATLVPTDERGYEDAIAAIGSYIRQQDKGKESQPSARILGIHFEGPFVSHHRCGALHREHFRVYDGDPRAVDIFANGGGRNLMTLAPEIQGGVSLARDLTARGIRVFIGHSQADPETLDRAVEAGARHITHFPNALDPLHHRKPGAVAWGLVRDDVSLDCIADFHHAHPLMLRLIYQSKGAKRMALISDAILAAGLGDGEYAVWGEKIAVREGRTALVGSVEATIAGSVITMRDALKNILSLGVPTLEAFHMASPAPARAAGVADLYGSIEAGKRADLAAFDEEMKVKVSIVGGEIAFDARQ
jgi:N-acetylglucosamine-6-phosphate deacetylase